LSSIRRAALSNQGIDRPVFLASPAIRLDAETCGKAIAGKWHTRLRRVSCEAVNGLGRKPKTGAQAKQGQRRAGIVRYQGAT